MVQTATTTREAFRRFLVEYTGCELQEATDGSLWPCGTCAIELLKKMGLDDSQPEYAEYNPEHDRHNEVWRAILQIRDASLDAEAK